MWKLDLDDEYFRIFDSNKLIAGYFDPDYGEIFPKANSTEIIAQMLKNHDKIPGGLLMIPLVKFGLFDTDLDIDIGELESHVIRVGEHLKKWKDFIAKTNNNVHSIRISHTDQDMLTITFPITFSEPTQLEKNEILKELFPTLDLLQRLGLL
ncbi:hypothetical protein Nlim_0899 [Candidatus Nitrosarchaeum limnium SFB1]|jgi:hypothetical protein|uniref:Uncharacterized protein n=1 Tax=Candidatus Nitrosarchaeum limnium SFB1 TaxID=886738 RepID=F3KK86_9ARCH|nr:hypothetical protein Nlim_0899 [Candidatus Nitrosarchaeum limnium SFB1]